MGWPNLLSNHKSQGISLVDMCVGSNSMELICIKIDRVMAGVRCVDFQLSCFGGCWWQQVIESVVATGDRLSGDNKWSNLWWQHVIEPPFPHFFGYHVQNSKTRIMLNVQLYAKSRLSLERCQYNVKSKLILAIFIPLIDTAEATLISGIFVVWLSWRPPSVVTLYCWLLSIMTTEIQLKCFNFLLMQINSLYSFFFLLLLLCFLWKRKKWAKLTLFRKIELPGLYRRWWWCRYSCADTWPVLRVATKCFYPQVWCTMELGGFLIISFHFYLVSRNRYSWNSGCCRCSPWAGIFSDLPH